MPFSSFGLHADLLRGVKDLAFTHPTPIQQQAIAPAMAGRDVLACAQTGSGKTAAFMLPTLHRLITRPPAPGPGGGRKVRVLVLTPTRELAAQILDHLNGMAIHTPISGAVIIGGVGMGPQIHAFRTGTEILIATPGRLLDHLRQPYARLDGIEVLILDEADRMLDMGFLPDIRRILRVVPAKRQTLFFSATMPPEIRQLTLEILKDPVMIQIERQTAPPGGITQAIYPVPQHLKTELLRKLLEHEGLESVIVFTRTKHRANRLAASLTQHGISCVPIHGNRSQGQRTAALAGFKAGQHRVLVATDIAARGIDIADVSHVINFDCPHIADDYIHRVGRTGRASAVGDAFTFVSDEEQSNLRTIERAIGKRLPRITLPDFDYAKKATEKLEIPIAERIAAIRAEKARARARQQARAQRSGFPQPGGGPGGYAGDQRGAPQRGPQAGQPTPRPQGQGLQFPGPRGRPQSNRQTGSYGGQGGGQGYHKPRQPGGGRGGKFGNRPQGRYTGPVGPR
jgi:ATP-dependent RNA helicase RhlE